MAHLHRALAARLAAAFHSAAGEPVDPLLRPSRRADFQADGAVAAHQRGREPRELAVEVVRRLEIGDLCSAAEVAGPGFINLVVRDDVAGRLATVMSADPRLGVPTASAPDTVVVDYSGPNAAKEMHVGHLRSTVIGDCLVRLLEWRGHTVIRQNHIGEWGTPFGMLIEHLLDRGEGAAAHEPGPGEYGDLGDLYRAARVRFDGDAAFAARARQRVVLLQSGDGTTLRLWKILVDRSTSSFQSVYDLLGVRLTAADIAGESTYHDQLADVVRELGDAGLLGESDGAMCVFPAGYTNREGEPLPLIVRKADGGFGYVATDLAALRHRLREVRGTRLLYVVGLPQRVHLRMVFATAREAGWTAPSVRVEHVGFGSVLGEDGKALASRAGTPLRLADLLDEAVRRAAARVRSAHPGLGSEEVLRIARSVGIGAVKYADLSTDRARDYVFDHERMLAFDGGTAPYLQYAHARIHAIFRRAGTTPAAACGAIEVGTPQEHALVLALLGFERMVNDLETSLQPHRLCGYLARLAALFTAFYENCPVVRAEQRVRDGRLALCALTARVLAQGLSLLGIEAPERM